MTGPSIVAGVAIGACLVAGAVVLAQPTRGWRQAAEHSRAFWLAWIAGSVVLGALAPVVAGFGWGATAWLAAWSTFGVLQPAMIADLVEVRRHLGRLRRQGRRRRAEARARVASRDARGSPRRA